MRMIEIDHTEFNEWKTDPEFGDHSWEENSLPVDEWRCNECDEPIGWQFMTVNDSEGIYWISTWSSGDPREEGTLLLCEDCVP